MNTKNTLTESYPALPVSDDLRMRVKRLAAQSEAKSTPKPSRRWAVAVACATVAVASGIALQPRIATASRLAQMNAALEGVRTAHLVRWQAKSVSDPTLEKSEAWFSGDDYRSEDSRGTLVFHKGKRYHFDPKRNQVIVKAAKGAAQFNSSGFSVKSMAQDIARWGWKDKLETLSATQVAITRDEPAGKVRILLQVDPKTNLPQSYELALLKNGAWEKFGSAEIRYNEPLDPKRFTGEFPGATVVDYDTARKQWREKVERVVAQGKLGERTIKIRDVRVNERGAVFVLYTCGKTYSAGDAFHRLAKGSPYWLPGTPRDWEVSLRGADGTRYAPAKIQFMGTMGKERKREYLGQRPVFSDGELLQGDWFIPLSPQIKAPTSVTLRINAHPQNLHGDALNNEQRKNWSVVGSWALQPTPQSGFLPDYWPHLVSEMMSESDEKELQRLYAERRAGVLEEERASLPQALEALNTELSLTAAPQVEVLLQKARVLGNLGRRAEGKATLLQALQLKRPQGQFEETWYWKAVAAAWYALGDEKQGIAAGEKVIALTPIPNEAKELRKHPETLRRELK